MAIGKKRVGGGLILVAAVFIGQEFFSWLVGRVLDLASDGISGMTWAAFPWQSAVAALMALVGGYLAFWPDRKQLTASPKQRAANLAVRAANIVTRFNLHRSPFGLGAEARDPFGGIIQDGISLLISFEKEDFRVPNMSALRHAEKRAVCMIEYFSRISPLLRDGHVEEAKLASKTFASDALDAGNEIQGYFA